MSKNVKRIEFEIRQALIDAGVVGIYGEIVEEEGSGGSFVEDGTKRIIIEHMHKDKQPLVIPYTGDWYGDVKEHFKLMAENYFNPDVGSGN